VRIFEHPNMDNFTCPICGKSDDKPVLLVGISETTDGNLMQAAQFHVDCVHLVSTKVDNDYTGIYMIFKEVPNGEDNKD